MSPGAGLDIFGEDKSHVPAGVRTLDRPDPNESLNRFSCLVTGSFFFLNLRLSTRRFMQ